MRLITLSLIILLYGCGGDSASQSPATPAGKTSAAADTKKPTKTYQNVEGFASPEAIKASEVPVYGKGKANFTVKVKGATPGPSDLIGFYAEQNYKADEAQIDANGNINFSCKSCHAGQTTYPQGLYYVKIAEERYLQIILGEDQEFVLETNLANPDGDMVVKGSDENEAFFTNLRYEKANQPKFAELSNGMKAAGPGTPEFTRLKAEQKSLTDARLKHLDEIYTKYPKTLLTNFKQAGQEPVLRDDLPESQQVFQYRQDFWNDVDWSDRRLLRTPVINNKLKRYFEVLTPQNQDSIFASAHRLVDQLLMYPEYYKFIANWVVRTYEPTKTTLMDPEFVHVRMLQRYFTKERAFWEDPLVVNSLQQRAGEMANSLMGDKGPNVIAKDLSGKTHSLMDSKKDYLIVYMFAPSCEHCQEQTPKLVKWYNEGGKEYADVFAIALDSNLEDPNELANYIKKTNMPFTCVWDATNRSIYAKYYVDITPEIYIMNPDRTIIAKNLKVFQIDTMIDRDREKRGQ